jgi:hypothetical protein
VLILSPPVAHQGFQPIEHGIAGGGGHALGGQAASHNQNHDGKERETTANHESLPKNDAARMGK